MIANIGSIDHKVYKLTRNDYTMYSKLKYTSNNNLSPFCVGDWVTYSSNKYLVFSDSMQKDILLTVYRENGDANVKLIDKQYITGIIRKPSKLPVNGYKTKLVDIPIEKRGIYSNIQIYSKNGKEFFGNVGDEMVLKEKVCELDCDKIRHEIDEKNSSVLKGIPEKYIIHGIVDYTIYHCHKPYKNSFFTQYNPYWDQLYHGVHILWDNKTMICEDPKVCYDKIHVGDILIDADGIIHIASMRNGKNGFYSFKHFQFHQEEYYKRKGIKLFAINDNLHIVPLVCLLWHYGLSLGANLDLC